MRDTDSSWAVWNSQSLFCYQAKRQARRAPLYCCFFSYALLYVLVMNCKALLLRGNPSCPSLPRSAHPQRQGRVSALPKCIGGTERRARLLLCAGGHTHAQGRALAMAWKAKRSMGNLRVWDNQLVTTRWVGSAPTEFLRSFFKTGKQSCYLFLPKSLTEKGRNISLTDCSSKYVIPWKARIICML